MVQIPGCESVGLCVVVLRVMDSRSAVAHTGWKPREDHGASLGTSQQLRSSVSLCLFGWLGSPLLRALGFGPAQFML